VNHPWTAPEDFGGKITATDKSGPIKYEGRFVWGAFSSGKERYRNGQIKYSGRFWNSYPFGKDIETYHVDGSVLFKGSSSYGREAEGQIFWPNGQLRYSGRFANDEPHSYPKETSLYFHNGHQEFRGVLSYGKPIGEGKEYFFYHANEKVNGNYNENGELVGHCILYYKNHEVCYEGQFLNGLKHGFGIEYYNNGTIKYDGYWCLGQRYGKGSMYWNPHYGRKKNAKGVSELKFTTARVKKKTIGKILYHGMWDQDKFHGKGKWCHLNGKVFYQGYFEKGQPQCDPEKFPSLNESITLLDDNGKQLFVGSWVDWYKKFPDYRDQIKIPSVSWGNPYLYREMFAPQLEEIESIRIDDGHGIYVGLINRMKLWLAEQEALNKVTNAMSSLVPRLSGLTPRVAGKKSEKNFGFFKTETQVEKLEDLQTPKNGLNIDTFSSLVDSYGPGNYQVVDSGIADVDMKNFFKAPIEEEEESEESIDVGPRGKTLKPLDLEEAM
jgi:antitoxin component YwqK of YwqJK toxin-antitoxin module